MATATPTYTPPKARNARTMGNYRPFSSPQWQGKTLTAGQTRLQERWNYQNALKQAGGVGGTTRPQRVQMQNVSYGIGNSPLARYAAKTAKFRKPAGMT